MNLILGNIRKHKPDLVVICGDITQLGPARLATSLLDQIPTDTFALPGNMDSSDVKEGIDNSNAINIDMKKERKGDYSFIGINGTDENRITRFFEENPDLVDKQSILISHVPPYGFQDKMFTKMHKGSKELRKIVERFHPKLVLFGHIHEDPGFTKKDDTIFVNCSIGKKGSGALIDIDKDNVNVEMLD